MRYFFLTYIIFMRQKNPSLHLLYSLSNRLKNKKEKKTCVTKIFLNFKGFRDYFVSVAHT